MSNTLNAALVIRNRAPSVCPVPCTHQVFTWASVILSVFAKVARSAEAKYFCLWKRFSSSQICIRVNEVRGFFRFGGVRFWYGWPMRRVGKAAYPGPNGKVTAGWRTIRTGRIMAGRLFFVANMNLLYYCSLITYSNEVLT